MMEILVIATIVFFIGTLIYLGTHAGETER